MQRRLLPIVGVLLLAVALILMWPSAEVAESTFDPNDLPELSVLIVTPDPDVGYARGIRDLLDRSHLKADVVNWAQAEPEFVEDFDVIVVASPGRTRDLAPMRFDFQKPVVAYGPYGCQYLGQMHLKNGHPYT